MLQFRNLRFKLLHDKQIIDCVSFKTAGVFSLCHIASNWSCLSDNSVLFAFSLSAIKSYIFFIAALPFYFSTKSSQLTLTCFCSLYPSSISKSTSHSSSDSQAYPRKTPYCFNFLWYTLSPYLNFLSILTPSKFIHIL